jgi:hypothetical protein
VKGCVIFVLKVPRFQEVHREVHDLRLEVQDPPQWNQGKLELLFTLYFSFKFNSYFQGNVSKIEKRRTKSSRRKSKKQRR